MNRENFESDSQYIEYLENKIRKINGVVDDIEYVCDQYIENTTETNSVQMTVYCALCVKTMLDTIRIIDYIEECVAGEDEDNTSV
jgi:hypothetical protein